MFHNQVNYLSFFLLCHIKKNEFRIFFLSLGADVRTNSVVCACRQSRYKTAASTREETVQEFSASWVITRLSYKVTILNLEKKSHHLYKIPQNINYEMITFLWLFRHTKGIIIIIIIKKFSLSAHVCFIAQVFYKKS